MPISLSVRATRLLKFIADHGGDEADQQLGLAFEKAIEKVAAGLHRGLLQEQGTPYGDDAALRAAADYRAALQDGDPE